MDALPWVTPIYKRDLNIENYFGGYLKHPYISFYTGRGCKSRCRFCLWPPDGGRTPLPRAPRSKTSSRKWKMGEKRLPAGEGILFDDA